MSLVYQLFIGGLMIALTVAIQAVCLDLIIHKSKSATNFMRNHNTYAWKPIISSVIVVSVFLVHVIQIWLWALLYLILHTAPLNSFSEALYFSTVTFSTVGYGDITLGPTSRMLSAIEATNGFLVFGWTTAFIFEVISQLYKPETRAL